MKLTRAMIIVSLVLAMAVGLVGCTTISPLPPAPEAPPAPAEEAPAPPAPPPVEPTPNPTPTPEPMPSPAPTPTPTPTPTPEPKPEPEPPPAPAPKTKVEILEHHLVREDYPPPASFSMTFVRGKVKNIGDVTLASIDVTIWVEYQVEGLEGRIFRQPGSIDLEPAAFKPGEVRDFEVLVQNGARENYDISVSVMPPFEEPF